MKYVIFTIFFTLGRFVFASDETCAPSQTNTNEYGHLLYSITDRSNGSKAYLFGTLHGGHEELDILPTYIVDRLSETKKVFFEMNLITDEFIKVRRAVSFLDGGRTLKDILSHATYVNLWKYINSLNLPENEKMKVDKATPYVLLSHLQGKNPESNKIKSLDAQLIAEVSRFGIEQDGIEAAEDPIAAIHSITNAEWDEYAAGMLSLIECQECVKKIEHLNSCIPKLVKKGDLEGVAATINRYNIENPWRSAFFFKFVQSRNEGMVNRISRLMNSDYKIFVSLGVSHLAGELGVIKLLRDKGYIVEQINN